MGIPTFGPNTVDWETRIDMDRLRTQRLARLRAQLERSELGAVLAFDFSNIRYMTATHIGTWAVDKMIRFALLVRGGEPIVWDFGSAAKHHQLYNPWLDYSKAHSDGDPHAAHHGADTRNPSGARAGISTLRGAINPLVGMGENVATKIKRELDLYGLADEPLGVDVIELPVLAALQAAGVTESSGEPLASSELMDNIRYP
jgi:Xaa-Pro aminopeptidase